MLPEMLPSTVVTAAGGDEMAADVVDAGGSVDTGAAVCVAVAAAADVADAGAVDAVVAVAALRGRKLATAVRLSHTGQCRAACSGVTMPSPVQPSKQAATIRHCSNSRPNIVTAAVQDACV